MLGDEADQVEAETVMVVAGVGARRSEGAEQALDVAFDGWPWIDDGGDDRIAVLGECESSTSLPSSAKDAALLKRLLNSLPEELGIDCSKIGSIAGLVERIKREVDTAIGLSVLLDQQCRSVMFDIDPICAWLCRRRPPTSVALVARSIKLQT